MQYSPEIFAKLMKMFVRENNIPLGDNVCDTYGFMWNVLYEVTGKRFSFEEMLEFYDFFTDVAAGKKPRIALFGSGDKFKGIYRLSKQYPLTKGLTERERQLMAFVVYQADCVRVYDEDAGEETWNMPFFKVGTQKVIEAFEWCQENNPSNYLIKHYSDSSKDDYGLNRMNPIEVISVRMSYAYLNAIELEDGRSIEYRRIGSFVGPDDVTVDGYAIFAQGEKINEIYICPYGSDNSMETPKGFRFKD